MWPSRLSPAVASHCWPSTLPPCMPPLLPTKGRVSPARFAAAQRRPNPALPHAIIQPSQRCCPYRISRRRRTLSDRSGTTSCGRLQSTAVKFANRREETSAARSSSKCRAVDDQCLKGVRLSDQRCRVRWIRALQAARAAPRRGLRVQRRGQPNLFRVRPAMYTEVEKSSPRSCRKPAVSRVVRQNSSPERHR